jgi:general stress protein 26
MERKEFESLALDIMSRADMLVLSTICGDPYPRSRALFNLRQASRFPALAAFHADKGLSVFLGTNTSSIKARELGQAPWASVYFMLPPEFKGLCLSGRAKPCPEAREALWTEGWEIYYPKGRDDPDYSVFRLDPVRAVGWSSLAAFDLEL